MRVSSVLFEVDEPIDESRARALAVNEVLREPVSEFLDDQRTKRRWCAAIVVAGTLLGVAAIGMTNVPAPVALALLLGGPAVGIGGYTYLDRQDPDVTVTAVEKGYWTGYSIPDEKGVVVYDASDSLDRSAFNLERLSDRETITEATERLADLDEFPVVMDRNGDVEATFTGTLEDVQTEIANAEQHTVEAPVVSAESPAAEAVEFFAERADEDSLGVDVAVPEEDAEADVTELADLERIAAADDDEAELEELSAASRNLVGDLSQMQETAVDLLNDHVAVAADALGLVSYHFYCPDCQMDDIDSRVSLSDADAGKWYCETCRSTHRMETVVPRHRIKDDVVNPTWDQLWAEKDDERREIYENIEDQKQELQEREFEQRREEIRTTTDRIRDLRSKIRDLKTQAKAAEGTVDEIGDLMVKYERLHERRKRQFQQEVQDSFAEIDAQTERILEETRNEEEERIERAEQEAKEKAQLMREEERRREMEKFVAEQQMANARTQMKMEQDAAHHQEEMAQQAALTQAEMAHDAMLHEEEMELERRHHRENWMLKTRGGTSTLDIIDRAKMWKDRRPFASASTYDGGGD